MIHLSTSHKGIHLVSILTKIFSFILYFARINADTMMNNAPSKTLTLADFFPATLSTRPRTKKSRSMHVHRGRKPSSRQQKKNIPELITTVKPFQSLAHHVGKARPITSTITRYRRVSCDSDEVTVDTSEDAIITTGKAIRAWEIM